VALKGEGTSVQALLLQPKQGLVKACWNVLAPTTATLQLLQLLLFLLRVLQLLPVLTANLALTSPQTRRQPRSLARCPCHPSPQ
jgi:hypothetical protein